MTWAMSPVSGPGQTSIEMIATEATDDYGGPVEYEFKCLTSGGHSSGWQSIRSYEDIVNVVDDQAAKVVFVVREISGAQNKLVD